MNEDQARDLILAIRELSARIDYWGEETRVRLTELIRAEAHGWRVKNYQPRGSLQMTEEWAQAKKAIVERLADAQAGMTKEEIRQFLMDVGFKRVAATIAGTRNVACPLAQLVKEQRAFVSVERTVKTSGFKRYRYWSREHYLRNYAQFSDDQQRDLVEAAIAEAKQEK
jgi:hypothetical protein